MIHSLSGGVLSDGEVYTFAKVDVAGTPCWYLAPFRVEVGANVLVPFGRENAEGGCRPHGELHPSDRARARRQGKAHRAHSIVIS